MGYVDPDGRFKRCFRPLDGFGDYMSDYKDNNRGIYHEHGFFEDGSGDNVGFSKSGGIVENEGEDRYQRCQATNFNEAVVRRALENIRHQWTADDYKMLSNNCQHFMDALEEEYHELMPY